ncbi:MAG: hypothetical protein Q7R85_03820 [bacterium]|nr:hypothetical protein [bacterium]
MTNTATPQELRQAFVELPDNVRQWLASEKILAVVIDINERLEYFGDKVSVIPWLITRLATKDLAPKYFMSELRDYLVVSDDEARAITEEIDKRILRPIEPALNRLDIDLNSLYLGQAAPVAAQNLAPQPISQMSPIRPMSPITEEMPTGPVILHTEKEEIAQTAQGKPGEATNMPRPTFSISLPQSKYKKPTAPPVTVRIETPGEDVGSKKYEVGGKGEVETQKQQGSPSTSSGTKDLPPKIMKVVHYSDFRTPLQ